MRSTVDNVNSRWSLLDLKTLTQRVYLLRGISVACGDVGLLKFLMFSLRFIDQHLLYACFTFTSNKPYHGGSCLLFALFLPRTERYHRTWCFDAGCIIRMLEAPSSHPLYGGFFFFGVSTETNGHVMKMGFFSSCAHDLCRWYQDYRNAQKKISQHQEVDIAAYSTRAFKDWYHLSSNGINPLSR